MTSDTKAMKLLVVGQKGQLGQALLEQAADLRLACVGVDLPEVDITRTESVAELFSRGPFSLVVNAAAYTAVDQAEEDVQSAYAVNKDGAANLAAACHRINIPLIHISTDYVFSGSSRLPYKPDDPMDPLGVYGKSKAAGEEAVRDQLPRHLIVRTSWLYGAHGKNFVKTMIQLGREKRVLKVVDDQWGCPTFAGDLAEAILSVAKQVETGRQPVWGTYHFTNAGVINWHQLAQKAIAHASRFDTMRAEQIVPVATSAYPTRAARPAFSALDCTSFTLAFGIQLKPWEASLTTMIERLYSA